MQRQVCAEVNLGRGSIDEPPVMINGTAKKIGSLVTKEDELPEGHYLLPIEGCSFIGYLCKVDFSKWFLSLLSRIG